MSPGGAELGLRRLPKIETLLEFTGPMLGATEKEECVWSLGKSWGPRGSKPWAI